MVGQVKMLTLMIPLLAGRLQMSALAHAAGSTSRAYIGPWNNAFVLGADL